MSATSNAGDLPAPAATVPHGTFLAPEQVQTLRRSKLFWTGLALKLACAFFFGSHFATKWFAPFVYQFVHSLGSDPWAEFLSRGESMAFPYGPGMLAIESVAFLPATIFSFDPSAHFGLLLLRLPLLACDLAICLMLMVWLRIHAKHVIVAYWLSPIVIYATYVHGQLDLVPTALLCGALLLMFQRRIVWSAVVFGLALATKAHLLVAMPFAVVYLYRLRRPRHAWVQFALVAGAVAGALYAVPLLSPAFRQMVLGSAEAKKVWSVVVPYGTSGLVLFAAPAALLIALLRFASYRKVNRELTLMFVGALYVGLVALVPPQPGWFIWSIPFVAYLGARFTRSGRFVLLMLSSTYLLYFFMSDPRVFLEALDPTLGVGFGARTEAALAAIAPSLGSTQAASIAWTLLFSAVALTGVEMYRKGVQSNSIYTFRDESFMIGIGGDSGAGKHTLARDLAGLLGPHLTSVDGDDDHKWERGHAMWRQFTHLNPRGNWLAQQQESMAALRRGGNVRKPHYDHDRGAFTTPVLIEPNEFVSVVGLHPFYLPSQRQVLHLKIFVDPEEEVRRAWKVDRDVEKRGYTKEQVLEQLDAREADSLKFVRPQMKFADIVVRHKAKDAKAETCELEIEMASDLEPLTLVDAFELLPDLTVEWAPDEKLTRDRVGVRGTVDANQIRILANALLPNADELVYDDEGWQLGGRGIAQLAMLHGISVRLRRSAEARVS